MRVTNETTADLRTVRVLRFPLKISARTTQHFDEVMREFALISMDTDREREQSDSQRLVPARLLALVDELTKNFAAFTAAVTADRDEAAARGDEEIDLTYRIPAAAAMACRELEALLDEVDVFCQSGRYLITLSTPPDSLAFRQWYLGEFIAQIDEDREPVPWPEYVAEHHAAADWA